MHIRPMFRAASACVIAVCVGSVASVLAQGPSSTAPASSYDLAITGARIVDGSGNPWYRGDVYLKGDTIALIDVGHRNLATKHTMDGRGLVLAPGFIDIHTHARRAILDIPTGENYARQGSDHADRGPRRRFSHSPARVSRTGREGSHVGELRRFHRSGFDPRERDRSQRSQGHAGRADEDA